MAIQLGGTMVLARLLTPGDFGLVAMVVIFVGIGELVRDFGLPAAALQAKSMTDQQQSNVFWVTVALSSAVAIALVLSGPLIALMYRENRLTGIIPALSGVLLLSGLQAQFRVRLARAMRFTVQVIIDVAAKLLGLGVAIATAILGWGYWALVMQQVGTTLVTLTATAWATRWLPGRPRRGADSMGLFRSGAHNGVANMLGYAADNVDNLMIGLLWGPAPLGLYSRAFQLFLSPIMAFFSPLTNVVVPTVNRATSEGRTASDLLAKAQTVLCGSSIGLLLITSVTADWLVPLLLGEQWHGAVPLLQILAIGGAFKALSQINYWAYLIEQQSQQLMLSGLVTKPLQILLVVVAAFFGIDWVAWAFVAGRAIAWPVNLIWLQRCSGQSAREFGTNGMRFALSAAIAYGISRWVIGEIAMDSPWLNVLIGAALSAAIYLGTILATPGGRREIEGVGRVARSMMHR
jgi:PST family polysaccharide transporter